MKILVIGASGMLAKPVIEHLDKAGFQLRLFSRNVNQSKFKKQYEIIQGDVFTLKDLNMAMRGCDAIHISLSNVNEALATKSIVDVALQKDIKLISMISGCTVAEKNRWFWMIENKYLAEQTIINSGIPYMIFRPTWFFESLKLMVRDGKASIIGKQLIPYHWVAAADYARMVANAYQKTEAQNKIFYVFGPESHLFNDLLTAYCRQNHPEIKKVSSVPVGVIKAIAFFTRNKDLKVVASMFRYFEKTKEMGDPQEANTLLSKPETTFLQWMKMQQ